MTRNDLDDHSDLLALPEDLADRTVVTFRRSLDSITV